jgi:hypothetical protein
MSKGIKIMMESSFDAVTVKRVYLIILLFVPGVGTLLYSFVWGWPAFWAELHQWIVFLLFLASIPVHESLHYCGFVLLNGVERKYVNFKFNRENMTPYVVCGVNTSVIRYKVASILPFVTLGASSTIYGLFLNNSTVFVVGLLNIVVCSGDLILYFLLSRMNNQSIVSRHTQRIGFVVVRP